MLPLAAALSALVAAAAAAQAPASVLDAVAQYTTAGSGKPFTLASFAKLAAGSSEIAYGLTGAGSSTVFVPTDAAFASVPADKLAAIASNPTALYNILSYHIAPGVVYSPTTGTTLLKSALIDGSVNKLLGNRVFSVRGVEQVGMGQRLIVTSDSSGVSVKSQIVAKVVDTLPAGNGVVHVVDSVFAIPGDLSERIAADSATLGPLGALLGALPANSRDAFAALRDVTIFAPAAAPASLSDAGAVSSLLSTHVVPGSFSSAELAAALAAAKSSSISFKSYSGETLTLSVSGSDLLLAVGSQQAVKIVKTDLLTRNGVVHVVEAALKPLPAGAALVVPTQQPIQYLPGTTAPAPLFSANPPVVPSVLPNATNCPAGLDYVPFPAAPSPSSQPPATATPTHGYGNNNPDYGYGQTAATPAPTSHGYGDNGYGDDKPVLSAASPLALSGLFPAALVAALAALGSGRMALFVALVAGISSISAVSAAADPFTGKCALTTVPANCTKPAVGAIRPTNFTIVPGFFAQDDPANSPSNYPLIGPSLGLLDNSTTRWATFQKRFQDLQCSDPNSVYKLMYVMRHGEGYHNVAESTYGTPAWNGFYSKIELYSDPEITSVGVQQTYATSQAVMNEYVAGMPLPEVLVSSPLTRALQTSTNVWDKLVISGGPRIKAYAVEGFRETISDHTCDRRRSITALKKEFPQFDFSKLISEEDTLWVRGHEEAEADRDARVRKALSDLFATESANTVAFVAHGGAITSLFKVIKHITWKLSPGSFVPVLVRGYVA
ncbi:putative phosphoglycerate mutase pmu1 [Polyrhizophydium stewartii]|uniref:Phosphoglycerate mutase pmu1 n=1 Tax=Polyrhizophydium stewartii TaxID=2732419 RepID=A0ABR4N542_9FUNG|nr:hypothetical protein HK105_002498 [Polyrhizophydium stewartii]